MNITITNPTMSSMEIADITGKQHAHVIRDIREMLLQLDDPNLDHEEYQELTDVRGYTAEIRLNKRLSHILVSGYSVPHRAKIVDRWLDLEAGLAPKTYAETLRALADTIEQQERLQSEKAALQVTLDMSMQWASVKKMESAHGAKFNWKPLKDFSLNNDYEIKSVFDANYTTVNAYHIDVWQAVYGIGVSPKAVTSISSAFSSLHITSND